MIDARLVVADQVVGVKGNAVEIGGGVVRRIGPVEQLRRPGLAEERYPGGVIVPGIVDAHFHPVAYASLLSGLSLKTAVDFGDLSARLRSRAASLDPGVPVTGSRLDDETLAEGRLPTRHDIDGWISDRPVLIHRYCGHIAVANTAALEAAGITAGTADPTGGSFDRDVDGLTGVLRETAIEPVSGALSGSNVVSSSQLVDAMTALAGLGITSIGAMVGLGDGPWAELGNEVEIVAAAARQLPIKLHCLVIANAVDDLHGAAEHLDSAGARVSFAGVKRFGDGSLGGHTAAMCLPFADRTDTTGMLRLDPELDGRLARAAIDLGGRVAVHAIGDCAVGATLDMFEGLIATGTEPNRLRVEHVSVITEADISRFARMGVTAVVQPAFIGSETSWLEARVGADRLSRTYAFRSLLDAGVAVAGSSDCPVEPPDPWAGMALAIDRAGLVPGQALTPEEALGLFTSGSAAAIGMPSPLDVGSPADFAVVDRDPTVSTADEIRQTEVIATWVDGEPVAIDTRRPTWND